MKKCAVCGKIGVPKKRTKDEPDPDDSFKFVCSVACAKELMSKPDWRKFAWLNVK